MCMGSVISDTSCRNKGARYATSIRVYKPQLLSIMRAARTVLQAFPAENAGKRYCVFQPYRKFR